MGTYAKTSLAQWEAIAAVQENYGVPDRPLALAVGCGPSTIAGRRLQAGWKQRKLPDDFMTAVMLREAGDAGPVDVFGDEDQPPLDEAALRRALDRLMTLIVNETARVGMGGLDPVAVKRLEVMSNIARSFEKLLELKVKLAPVGEAAGGAADTARVLKEMDRRVDELAAIRAREIIDHHCIGGTCGARQFADEIARTASGG